MQFTKLRLVGFKSFVDPTELHIRPGLTGIVGPNGCGKSNLLDALGWVMGETRPTAMRGDGMEDVIFAGSASRPARSAAEVTLTLDNSERRAPPAFNGADEIEVARRLTRDGGSVFRANGREARARDIQMLFADAASGAGSPALVRQGQIAELIHARPKARRRILEEAAGISGLFQRRHEAELKLGQTEANLARVGDLVGELDHQLAALARQARQAARYRELSAAIRRTESLLLRLARAAAAAARARAEAARDEAVRAAARAEVAAAERGRAAAGAAAALGPLREEEAVAGAVLERLRLEGDRLAEAAGQAEAARAEAARRLAQIAADREREAALRADAEATLARLGAEAAELDRAAEGEPERLAGAEAAVAAAGAALALREEEHERLAAEAARRAAAALAAARRREAAAKALARARSECAAAEAAGTAAAREAAAADARREAARAAALAAETARGAAERRLAEAEAARAAAAKAETAARAGLAEAEGTARAIRAEIAGLDRLLAAGTGRAAAILDRVRARPGAEAALAAALGEELLAPEAGADGASGWTGAATGAAPAPLPEGALPLAAEVTAPAVLAPRLARIGLVDRAAGAALQPRLAPGQRLVSREGDLWRWDGFRRVAGSGETEAARRLRSLNRREALGAEAAAAEAALAAARTAAEAARAALETAGREEAAARTGRRSAEAAAAGEARAADRAEAEVRLVAERIAALRTVAARTAEDLAAAEAEAAAAEAEGAAALAAAGPAGGEGMAEARGALEAARRAMREAEGRLDSLRREARERARRAAAVADEIRVWSGRGAAAGQRLADLSERVEAAEAARAAAERRPEEIAAERARLARALAEAEARRRRAAEALAGGEAAARAAEAARREAERVASEAREARARAAALLEAALVQEAEAEARLAAQCEAAGDAPGAAEPLPEPGAAELPAREAVEIELQRLRRARDALGAVNLRAEEDRALVEAERAALARERDDLAEAVAKLRFGIAELNREGRARLLAAFEGVTRNFAALFRHLFGGGEANLVLVESEDPLDAGLEILCMPPGKRLAALSLLSGGEQALTALSLIFAVFLAGPAPVCVLDEVDAPLDDANVARFCDLLDEMARRTRTRFLVITHHAVTMSRMDRLYGVTMAESGVSQLVSVDLRAAAALAEA